MFENALQQVTLINLKVICVRKFGESASKSKHFYVKCLGEHFIRRLYIYWNMDIDELEPLGNTFEEDDVSISSNISSRNTQKINVIVEPANNTEKENQDCAICLESETYSNLVQLNCSHTFCSSCIASSFANHHNDTRPTCALCRGQIHSLTVRNSKINNVFINKTYNYITIVS
jgi:hypothetical protein